MAWCGMGRESCGAWGARGGPSSACELRLPSGVRRRALLPPCTCACRGRGAPRCPGAGQRAGKLWSVADRRTASHAAADAPGLHGRTHGPRVLASSLLRSSLRMYRAPIRPPYASGCSRAPVRRRVRLRDSVRAGACLRGRAPWTAEACVRRRSTTVHVLPAPLASGVHGRGHFATRRGPSALHRAPLRQHTARVVPSRTQIASRTRPERATAQGPAEALPQKHFRSYVLRIHVETTRRTAQTTTGSTEAGIE